MGSKLEDQCINAQQRKHVDSTMSQLRSMEQSLTELKKDCKSIKQKGQSLKSKDLNEKSESLSILKWIKFATNYHQKQSEWELEKNAFISKRMKFLQNAAKSKKTPSVSSNCHGLNDSASTIFSSIAPNTINSHISHRGQMNFEYEDNSTMAIKKRIDFSSTNHNHFGSTVFSINDALESKDEEEDDDDFNDSLPRIQYNTDCDTSFATNFTTKSHRAPNSSKLRKFQSLNIQYMLEKDPNKKKMIKRQMDKYDAIT